MADRLFEDAQLAALYDSMCPRAERWDFDFYLPMVMSAPAVLDVGCGTGMMLHQDGSRHEWVPGKKWDLIVTMDDATNEHYSMFFVEEEGTGSSFAGVREVIVQQGLFSSLYTD